LKVLVLGAGGMIGNSIMKVLSAKDSWEVFGTIRNERIKSFFSPRLSKNLISNFDIFSEGALENIIDIVRPNVVVNCIGITKHLPQSKDPLILIPINALFPHKLAILCKLVGARLIHISTDCVFSGAKGAYRESDYPDASDLYGRSKSLGEIMDSHAVTIRTSTIGHELESQNGLLEWFLAQEDECSGYSHAIFSGLPTVVLSEIIRDIVIPNTKLSGLYHVGASPITKLELLEIIAQVYKRSIRIKEDGNLSLNRSLDCDRFYLSTGYIAPSWPDLIKRMYESRE
jgi:dTDP-4-dehydrorhamnose reductase